MRYLLILIYASLWTVGLASEDLSNESLKPLLIPIFDGNLTIDGRLDEAAWSAAAKIELNYEVQPGENVPPPVKTEVFLTYNSEYLFIGFICHDPRPEEILARFWAHDKAFDDDWVGVALDTFNDQKRAYEMLSNPLGIQMDAINDDINKDYDLSWNAIWESAGSIHEKGYTVEMAIPFNQIRFQVVDGNQIWGFDCFRRYPRSVHHHIGAFPRDRDNPNYLSQTLKLEGFAGIKSGKNIQLTPTLTYSQVDQISAVPDGSLENIQSETEAGITGRWSITPSLTLNGAINPDFSQVEADAIQLTINEQFALFYQETRPFFKEGADYFNTPINLLHTRTVADPSVALKVTSKTGAHTIGVFTAKDEITNLIIPGSFGSNNASYQFDNTSSVGRYRLDFGENSTVGLMMTSREGSGYYNRVIAGDLNYRFTKNDDIILQFANTQTKYNQDMQTELGVSDDELVDEALHIRYRHQKRNYSIWGRYDNFGENFRSDLGFNPQVGFSLMRLGAEYKWYFENTKPITDVGFGGDYDRRDDQDGDLIEEEYEIWAWFSGRYQSNSSIGYQHKNPNFPGKNLQPGWLV